MRFTSGMYRRRVGAVCLLWAITVFPSCSGIRELAESAGVKPPTVQFVGAKLTGLSFQDVDFMFDIQIQNQNPVGVKLAGFDYDFLVDGKSFLSGDQEEGVEIKAQGDHIVHLPVSLGFSNIYETFSGLKNEDSSTYQLKCGFSFNLPVLGPVRVPVSTGGEIPMIKLPSVDLDGLKLNRLGLTGADLELGIRLKNPNAFSVLLEKFNYRLLIGGQPWASGEAQQNMEVSEKGENLLTLPIMLNFAQIGQSVYQMLTGDQTLEYEIKGDVDLSSSLPLLKKTTLTFDRSGLTELIR